MALTVRPDDEVYQFDTVWLGPDEYTLPIQARYVAWGTWLACFLVTTAILVPIGGSGPGGVVGSVLWSVALSVVASRAVMLVVDHERPLRSLPALFGAEARAALASSRHGEKTLLIRPSRVRVREVPERARRIRDRKRRIEQHKLEQRGRRRRVPAGVTPATRLRPGTVAATRPEVVPEVLPASAYHTFQSYQPGPWAPAERGGPVWGGRVANADGGDDDWGDSEPGEPPWYPAMPTRRPAGSLPPMRTGEPTHGRPAGPVPGRPAQARPRPPQHAGPQHAAAQHAAAPRYAGPQPTTGRQPAGTPQYAPPQYAGPQYAAGPPATGHQPPARPQAGRPPAGNPQAGSPPAGSPQSGGPQGGRRQAGGPQPGGPQAGPQTGGPPGAQAPPGQAAPPQPPDSRRPIEERILLPARKTR